MYQSDFRALLCVCVCAKCASTMCLAIVFGAQCALSIYRSLCRSLSLSRSNLIFLLFLIVASLRLYQSFRIRVHLLTL